MKTIVHTAEWEHCYPVTFTRNLFDVANLSLASILGRRHGEPRRGLVVVDTGVARARPQLVGKIRDYLFAHGEDFVPAGEPVLVPGGETVTRDPVWCERIRERVAAYDLDAGSFVLAVGGGAVLDAVGVALGTLDFGPRLVRIPTTAAAQCRAAYTFRNRIGGASRSESRQATCWPWGVMNDGSFFCTLSDADRRACLGEALRAAVFSDAQLFSTIEREPALFMDWQGPWEQLVRATADIHLTGEPAVSGHSSARCERLAFEGWVANSLQAIMPVGMREGEALAVGLAFECLYASKLGVMSRGDCERVLALLDRLGFQLAPSALHAGLDKPNSPESLMGGIRKYERMWGDAVRFRLPSKIGGSTFETQISTELAADCAVALLEREAGGAARTFKRAA